MLDGSQVSPLVTNHKEISQEKPRFVSLANGTFQWSEVVVFFVFPGHE